MTNFKKVIHYYTCIFPNLYFYKLKKIRFIKDKIKTFEKQKDEVNIKIWKEKLQDESKQSVKYARTFSSFYAYKEFYPKEYEEGLKKSKEEMARTWKPAIAQMFIDRDMKLGLQELYKKFDEDNKEFLKKLKEDFFKNEQEEFLESLKEGKFSNG